MSEENTNKGEQQSAKNIQGEIISPEKSTAPDTEEQTSSITDHHTSYIQDMEVHHHPDLHHKRKKFKEYFLEFLMIFLAVTLGFLQKATGNTW